jgi:hypothetical protein
MPLSRGRFSSGSSAFTGKRDKNNRNRMIDPLRINISGEYVL